MTADLTGLAWRKSSRSNGTSNCIEMATDDLAIYVRDSKDPNGPSLKVAPEAFAAFTAMTKELPSDL